MRRTRLLLNFLPLLAVLGFWIAHVLIEKKFDYFKYYGDDPLAADEAEHLSFRDSAAEAGLVYAYENSNEDKARERGVLNYKNFTPVSTPVAVGDVDGDGFEDVLVANGFSRDLLLAFRNRGDGTFERFPANSGLRVFGPGELSGIAIVDFDNDGDKDVVYTSSNPTGGNEIRLLRNRGRGVFEDASELIADRSLGSVVTGVRVIDVDRDGYPDVYVTALFRNILSLNPDTGQKNSGFFQPNASRRDLSFAGPNYLYLNHRGKSFARVENAGGAGNYQLAWDAAIYDVNGDGYQDIIVANDFSFVRTYENNKAGGFVQTTTYRFPNQYVSSNMGVNVADLDGDQRFDFFITNAVRSTYSSNNTNHALVQQEKVEYHDRFEALRLGKCGWGWGSQVADLDLDGHDEVLVANGYFDDGDRDYFYHWSVYSSLPPFLVASPGVLPPTQGFHFSSKERNCLFKKRTARGPFADVALAAGVRDLANGRGVALIDVANEGRYSFLISNYGEQLVFYRNVSPRQHNWLGFRFEGSASGKDAFGASVTVSYEGKSQRKYFHPTQGFSSQTSSRLLFGFGSDAPSALRVRVLWPSGKETEHSELALNRYHLLREGP